MLLMRIPDVLNVDVHTYYNFRWLSFQCIRWINASPRGVDNDIAAISIEYSVRFDSFCPCLLPQYRPAIPARGIPLRPAFFRNRTLLFP
jgi:hypothetical protein